MLDEKFIAGRKIQWHNSSRKCHLQWQPNLTGGRASEVQTIPNFGRFCMAFLTYYLNYVVLIFPFSHSITLLMIILFVATESLPPPPTRTLKSIPPSWKCQRITRLNNQYNNIKNNMSATFVLIFSCFRPFRTVWRGLILFSKINYFEGWRKIPRKY